MSLTFVPFWTHRDALHFAFEGRTARVALAGADAYPQRSDQEQAQLQGQSKRDREEARHHSHGKERGEDGNHRVDRQTSGADGAVVPKPAVEVRPEPAEPIEADPEEANAKPEAKAEPAAIAGAASPTSTLLCRQIRQRCRI